MGSQEQVGKKLKKARKEKGLRQSDVAKKVGITSNYYSMIERGTIESPGSVVMTKVAKVLGLEASDVLPI